MVGKIGRKMNHFILLRIYFPLRFPTISICEDVAFTILDAISFEMHIRLVGITITTHIQKPHINLFLKLKRTLNHFS